jgi:N-acetylneuraminate lyase
MSVRLIAAPHTPFTPAGDLHLAAVDLQARLLSANGVAGVFIGGSTGEYSSLTVAERMQLAEAWVAAAGPVGLDVIVHVGHNAQPDAVALARHAGTLPVKAIASIAPGYFRPQHVDDLIEFFAPVAQAGPHPFYFYDIPSMNGVNLPTVEFLRRSSERIPNLAGVKFTNPDLAQFQECLHFAEGRYDILFGCDEHLLAGYALGARGAVGSTYNFAPGLYHRLTAAWDRGDAAEARRLQLESVRLVRCLQSYGYMAAAKSMMGLLGAECGPVRPPLRNLSAAQRSELRERLQAEGLAGHLAQPAATH